jgi:hypothetical protein
MSYSTPHHAHEYMKAAALAVVHQFALACQRKQPAEKKSLLLGKREIDFNSRLAMFFGTEASISAQGVKESDLVIASPTLEVELKYCRPKPAETQPVNSWDQVINKDWKWLLKRNAAGGGFKKIAWVVFFPSIDIFKFHQCFQIPGGRLVNGQVVARDYAPFTRLVATDPANPKRLAYEQQPWAPDVVLKRVGAGAPIRVRRQIVGSRNQPVWALIFSRLGHDAATALRHLPTYDF